MLFSVAYVAISGNLDEKSTGVYRLCSKNLIRLDEKVSKRFWHKKIFPYTGLGKHRHIVEVQNAAHQVKVIADRNLVQVRKSSIDKCFPRATRITVERLLHI